jgi:hypothetical protein
MSPLGKRILELKRLRAAHHDAFWYFTFNINALVKGASDGHKDI